MEQLDEFQDLMKSLLKIMDIVVPSGTTSEVYTVTFVTGVEVHLLNSHAGWIDLISEAGVLRDREASGVLLELMALNQPSVSINIDKDSGTVMVWARLQIASLDALSLAGEITELAKTVQQAKQTIDCRDAASPFTAAPQRRPMLQGKTSNNTLAQLQRRN